MIVTDALGREVSLAAPPSRVVSLVPSETESVAELVGIERLVGRTDYCVEPRAAIEVVPACGGTKRADVERIVALMPDLVLANKEENTRRDVDRLLEAGIVVHVSFPQTVEDALAYLTTLAKLLGVEEGDERVRAIEARVERARARATAYAASPLRVFVPIWMDPLMTMDARTFGSDLLRTCGAENVFGDRARRYPLAADLRHEGVAALSEAEIGERDTRYPRVTLEEVAERAPDAILLPDEPYAFSDADARAFAALDVPAARRSAIAHVDGKDLFWYGTRVGRAAERLSERIDALRAL